MSKNGVELLTDAIARNSAIVLSLPSAGMLRHHKSRFLADEPDGFWIESVCKESALLDELIASQANVGISFRAGPQKVSFVVPMIQRKPDFKMNAANTLEAIQLVFPADVKAVQRRNNYRVRIPQDSDLVVRIWRIAEHFFLNDKPMASQELLTRIRDISVGGLGVFLHAKGEEPPKVLAGERLRISLRYRELEELILEGRLRYLPPPTSATPVRAGIQFKKMENNLEGRQNLAALTRIVGELHRDEVRRTRLGIKIVE
jgi:c-di-GMP-binding flagellar brake protein YcgR